MTSKVMTLDELQAENDKAYAKRDGNKLNPFFAHLNEHFSHDRDPDVITQLFDSTIENPRVFAQFLMDHLGDCESFSEEDKVFWLEAAMHMGPDWIAKLRTVVNFMRVVDGFGFRVAE